MDTPFLPTRNSASRIAPQATQTLKKRVIAHLQHWAKIPWNATQMRRGIRLAAFLPFSEEDGVLATRKRMQGCAIQGAEQVLTAWALSAGQVCVRELCGYVCQVQHALCICSCRSGHLLKVELATLLLPHHDPFGLLFLLSGANSYCD